MGECFPWRGVTFKVAAVGPAGVLLQPVKIAVDRLMKSGPVNFGRMP